MKTTLQGALVTAFLLFAASADSIVDIIFTALGL